MIAQALDGRFCAEPRRGRGLAAADADLIASFDDFERFEDEAILADLAADLAAEFTQEDLL